jgi:hypothetical protein
MREGHTVTLGDLPGNPEVQPPLGELCVGHFVLSTFRHWRLFLKVLLQLRHGLVSDYKATGLRQC